MHLGPTTSNIWKFTVNFPWHSISTKVNFKYYTFHKEYNFLIIQFHLFSDYSWINQQMVRQITLWRSSITFEKFNVCHFVWLISNKSTWHLWFLYWVFITNNLMTIILLHINSILAWAGYKAVHGTRNY